MEEFIQIIKDYGAAIISTISVGGVAAIGAIIVKVKGAIDKIKESTNKITKQKEESEEALKARYAELNSTIKLQNEKIDTLTEEISRVKGNRKN